MSSKYWSGRFNQDVNADVLNYTETTHIDSRLIKYDIIGSIAHALMLYKRGINAFDCTKNILSFLIALLDKNDIALDPSLEDVHLNIESMLTDECGPEVGGRLHTARSRNDQVCVDTKMYLRDEIFEIQKLLAQFIEMLLSNSLLYKNTIAVGYTHGQGAQPISYGYWLSSYASMLTRDMNRLLNALHNVNQSPLGSCALAGTSFDIDRNLTCTYLGFPDVLYHGLDATSSRDFVSEFLSSMTILMVNLSRLAEEVVLWSSFEYKLLELRDEFCTGSSIMPQKKNPVVAELVKGRTGRVIGAFVQNVTMIKGVQMGYNCDLQEDKPYLWDCIDTIKSSIFMSHKQIESASFDENRAIEICFLNFSTITELANWLTKNRGLPFRKSHHLTGELTQYLLSKNYDPRNTGLCAKFLNEKNICITEQDLKTIFDPRLIVQRQNSVGGTSPESVEKICANLKATISSYSDEFAKWENFTKDSFVNLIEDAKSICESNGNEALM